MYLNSMFQNRNKYFDLKETYATQQPIFFLYDVEKLELNSSWYYLSILGRIKVSYDPINHSQPKSPHMNYFSYVSSQCRK